MRTTSTAASRPTPGSCSRTPAGIATTWPAACCGRWPTARPTSGRSSACPRSAKKGPAIRATGGCRASRSGRQFKSAADLEIIRQQDAKAYAALYQQNPSDASMAEWPPSCFGDWIWVPPEKWPREFDLRVVCVDASKGKNDKQGDYSAIVFLGVGKDKLLYVDAILDRIVLDQLVRKTVLVLRREEARFRGHRGRAVPGIAGPRVPPAVRRAVRPAVADVRDDERGASPRSPASAG